MTISPKYLRDFAASTLPTGGNDQRAIHRARHSHLVSRRFGKSSKANQ
jgi:hypothetical protein